MPTAPNPALSADSHTLPLPRHIGRYTPYVLLALAVSLFAVSDKTLLLAYGAHALIGVIALGCGTLGRRVCQHLLHQVTTTVALLLIEAVVTVQLIG